MAQKLFAGLEDDHEVVGEPLSVVDMIQLHEDEKEIAGLENEIEQTEDQIGQAEAFTAGLEAMIDTEVKIVEQGAASKGATLMAIQNTLLQAEAFPGEPESYSTVGLEDADADPVAGLEASTSDKRNLLQKALDGIKKLWAKVRAMTLKATAKILGVVGRRGKKIDDLKANIKDMKKVKIDDFNPTNFFGQDLVEKYKKKYSAFLSGSNNDVLSISAIIKELGGMKELPNRNKKMKKSLEEVMKSLADTGITKNEMKLASILQLSSTLFKATKADMEKVVDDRGKNLLEKCGDAIMGVRFTGNTIKALIDIEDYPIYATFTLKDSVIKGIDFKSDVPDSKDVLSVLTTAKTLNDDIKNTSKDVDDLNKIFLKLYDDTVKKISNQSDVENKFDASRISAIKKFYLSGPRIGFDIIMSQYNMIDLIIDAASMYERVAKGKKKEKEDKKKK